MPTKKDSILSKSRLMTGIQCSKALYFTLHRPELAVPVSPTQQAIFDTGNLVGLEAQKRYPSGYTINAPFYDRKLSLAQTEEALHKNEKVIYETSFLYDGIYARVDIFESTKKGWNVIEVKSTTSVKDEHILDVAIQVWILKKLKHKLNRFYLMHLNNECVAPDLSNLFHLEDITELVESQLPEIEKTIRRLQKVALLKKEPLQKIGAHCDAPYECAFKSHCFKDMPENNVFELPRIGVKAWELYHSGQKTIHDLNEEDFKGNIAKAIRVVQSGKSEIEKPKIRKAIEEWSWPLIFLDFETLADAIPIHKGTKPYSQFPYQYSCHVWSHPKSGLNHFEHLHTESTDPRPQLIESLIKNIPKKGSVVAYNMSFEKRVLNDLAKFSPKHKKALDSIIERLVDPLPIFQKHVYHPQFSGSFSIKSVAPALIGKSLSYKGLSISDGNGAALAVRKLMTNAITDGKEYKQTIKDLLNYCRQDTLAMVEIVKWLFKI